MGSPVDELWNAVQSRDALDALWLWDTLARIGPSGDGEDERTRLLISRTRKALNAHFGDRLVRFRLGTDVRFDPADEKQFLDGRGFHGLEARVQNVTHPETLLQILRYLGERTHTTTTLIIGGAVSLMFDALIVRTTDDADIVDEIPTSIRQPPGLIDEVAETFGLRLTHFQSHYLPNGWSDRTKSIGQFGSIEARRVDPIDTLVGKMFSTRPKDFKDLLAAFPRVDRESLANRLRTRTENLRAEPASLAAAIEHWYILTGERGLPK